MENSLVEQIIELSEKHWYNAYMISNGSGISAPTVYKILKKNCSGVKKKTIERVFNFLKQIDDQVEKKQFGDLKKTKEYKLDAFHLKEINEKIGQLANDIKSESKKINEINEKIDMLFEIIQAGSQQLTMSLVQNSEIKTKIDISDNNLSEKIKSLTKKIIDFSDQNKKSF